MVLAGAVSRRTLDSMTRSSWIRRMFEVGAALKRQVGAQNVFDYTLGNPIFDPPAAVQRRLVELAANPGGHGYMNNAGFPDVRARLADHVTRSQLLPEPLTENQVVMTVGAAGALNVALKTILDPGDEVVAIAPYFAEYPFYVDNHQGTFVVARSKPDFQLDLEAIEQKISPRTKAIILNNPNNPTGVVYDEVSYQKLQEIIARKEAEYGHIIYLITDEPYAGLLYDGVQLPSALKAFPHSIYTTSHSKDLSLAGERIGYLVISSGIEDRGALFDGLVFNNRILGFINAPALMQRLVAEFQGTVVGLDELRARRDLLLSELTTMGYEIVRPSGTFYMFPRSPIRDDVAFAQKAMEYNLLVVPGVGFYGDGHFRLSYSSIPVGDIRRSLPAFSALAKFYGLREG